MPFCSNCGREVGAHSSFCDSCGYDLSTGGRSRPAPTGYGPSPSSGPQLHGTPPDSHLAKAILATLLCCLPLGIVAIVKAASVNGKFIAGDIQGAHQAAESANSWANWSIGLGLVGGVLYAIMMLATGV